MLADLIGPDSLIVIAVVVVVLLFGGTRLPKLARGLGSASHEFKKGMKEGDLDKGDSSTSKAKGDDKTSGPTQSN
jgi:sec-independent protein translocase protein TatA